MIRGYIDVVGTRRRPFVHAIFTFPTLGDRGIDAELLIDTGADRTVLTPNDSIRLLTDVRSISLGLSASGIGGQIEMRVIEARLTLGDVTIDLDLALIVPPSYRLEMPSLLGRDVLSQFALFYEDSAERVFLLEPQETAQLGFPAG